MIDFSFLTPERDKLITEYDLEIEKRKQNNKNIFIQQTTPKEYWKADIKKIDKKITEFIYNDKIFCWIFGNKGVGKTYSLYAVRNHLIIDLNDIYFEIKMEGELDYDVNFKRLNAIDNLAISDNKMKFLADYYFNLIDWHWKTHKKLFLTSTISINKWLELLSKYNIDSAEAISSRFSNKIDNIELFGNDKRKSK